MTSNLKVKRLKMTNNLKWQWFWNLPEIAHVLVKRLTGYVLMAEYNCETFEPIALVWWKTTRERR